MSTEQAQILAGHIPTNAALDPADNRLGSYPQKGANVFRAATEPDRIFIGA